MSVITNIYKIRDHIKSPEYKMTCCTVSESLGDTYLMALKYRGLLPKLREVRNMRDLNFWAIGHLIKMVSH